MLKVPPDMPKCLMKIKQHGTSNGKLLKPREENRKVNGKHLSDTILKAVMTTAKREWNPSS